MYRSGYIIGKYISIEMLIEKTEDAYIENILGKITKKEIMDHCHDISQTTVEKALSDLVKQDVILKIGGGRYTQYVFNRG